MPSPAWASSTPSTIGVKADLAAKRLRIVLEPYAPEVPGLYLYFPIRSQVSATSKAFVEVPPKHAKERAWSMRTSPAT